VITLSRTCRPRSAFLLALCDPPEEAHFARVGWSEAACNRKLHTLRLGVLRIGEDLVNHQPCIGIFFELLSNLSAVDLSMLELYFRWKLQAAGGELDVGDNGPGSVHSALLFATSTRQPRLAQNSCDVGVEAKLTPVHTRSNHARRARMHSHMDRAGRGETYLVAATLVEGADGRVELLDGDGHAGQCGARAAEPGTGYARRAMIEGRGEKGGAVEEKNSTRLDEVR
jgi:hypothetical protein